MEITDPREFLRRGREKGSALCDTSTKCPRVYRSDVNPFTKEANIDYVNFRGCILWENIDTILEWNMSTVKQQQISIFKGLAKAQVSKTVQRRSLKLISIHYY